MAVSAGLHAATSPSLWGSALQRQVTSIKAHVEVEEQHERDRVRPRQRLALPSPRPAAAAIAVTAVEVRAGVRPPWHLERVSHYSLWRLWEQFAQPAPPNPAATAALPLTVLIQEPTPGLVNATVTVRFAGTVEPIALALDGARGWWELMELECSSDLTHRPPFEPPTTTAPPVEELGRPPPPIRRPSAWPATTYRLPPPSRWPPPELGALSDPFDGPDIDLT